MSFSPQQTSQLSCGDVLLSAFMFEFVSVNGKNLLAEASAFKCSSDQIFILHFYSPPSFFACLICFPLTFLLLLFSLLNFFLLDSKNWTWDVTSVYMCSKTPHTLWNNQLEVILSSHTNNTIFVHVLSVPLGWQSSHSHSEGQII